MKKKGDIMSNTTSQWQTKELSRKFLEGVRGAIPLADKQIEVLLTLVKGFTPKPKRIVDLGCGDGILGRTLIESFPKAEVTFIDFSEPMLEAARSKIGGNNRAEIFSGDFRNPSWMECVDGKGEIDVAVSGLAIHHQSDKRKKEIYGEILNILKKGGLFLNLEHVSSASTEIERIFDGYFVDHLYEYHRKTNNDITREIVEGDYHKRPDKVENILASVEEQCKWLRDMGYGDVDCFFKLFEVAIFGGRKR